MLFDQKSLLCITLPSASRTACDVKFSEGMRFIKCFCLLFSYAESVQTVRVIRCVVVYLLDDVVYGRVGLFKVGREKLYRQSVTIAQKVFAVN